MCFFFPSESSATHLKVLAQESSTYPPPHVVLVYTLHHLTCPSQRVGRVSHRAGNEEHYLAEQEMKLVHQKRSNVTAKTGICYGWKEWEGCQNWQERGLCLTGVHWMVCVWGGDRQTDTTWTEFAQHFESRAISIYPGLPLVWGILFNEQRLSWRGK